MKPHHFFLFLLPVLIIVLSKISFAGTSYLFPLAECKNCSDYNWYISQDDDIHGYKNESAYDFTIPGNKDMGKPILSVADGKIIMNGKDSSSFNERGNNTGKGWGYYVIIEHSNGIFSRYAHLASPSHLKAGDPVKAGEIIGRLGDSGKSIDGAHLHFGMWSGTLYQKTKYIPSQLGQYSSLTKFDNQGNISHYLPQTPIYDPHGKLSEIERSQYSLVPITVTPNSTVSPFIATASLFNLSGDHYFKAPHTIEQLPELYKSNVVGFSTEYGEVISGNGNAIIDFIDTGQTGNFISVALPEQEPEEARSIAEKNMLKEIQGLGIEEKSFFEGLAKLEVIMEMNKDTFENSLRSFIGSEKLVSLIKRFSGAMGSDLVISDITQGFQAILNSIRIPEVLNQNLRGNRTNTYDKVLEKNSKNIFTSLVNSTQGKTAGIIGLTLLVAMVLILQSEKKKEEIASSLQNLASLGVANVTLGKYWNYLPSNTRNWLSSLSDRKDPDGLPAETLVKDGNIKDALTIHQKELEKEMKILKNKNSLTKSEQKYLSQIHNGLLLINRIHKNIIPAKHGENNDHTVNYYEDKNLIQKSGFLTQFSETIGLDKFIGFFKETLSIPVFPPGKPKVLGWSSGSQNNEESPPPNQNGETIPQTSKKSEGTPSTTTNATGFSSASIAQAKNQSNNQTKLPSFPSPNKITSSGSFDEQVRAQSQIALTPYGIKMISFNSNHGTATYAISKDYPEGYNTEELRASTEKKVNDLIQNTYKKDPYAIITPMWEDKLLSPTFPNGIKKNNFLDDTNLAGTFLLFQKLQDQTQGIQVKNPEPYKISDILKVSNTTNLNNAGIKVIQSQELPEDLKILMEGSRGSEQGEEDKMVFKKALVGITMTGWKYKLKSSRLIFGTTDLISLLRNQVEKVQKEVAWEKELQKRQAANNTTKKDFVTINALSSAIRNTENKIKNKKEGAYFIPEVGLVYGDYIFDSKESLQEYLFWEKHGGLINFELKTLIKQHTKPMVSLENLEKLKLSSKHQVKISNKKNNPVGWNQITKAEEARKNLIETRKDFLDDIQNLGHLEPLVPKSISSIPNWEKYAIGLHIDRGIWYTKKRLRCGRNISFARALQNKIAIDYQKLWIGREEEITKTLRSNQVAEIILNGKKKYIATNGEMYDDLNQAKNISYLFQVKNNVNNTTFRFSSNGSKPTLTDLEKGIISQQKSALVGYNRKQTAGLTKYLPYIGISRGGNYVDIQGKSHRNFQEALDITKKELDKMLVINDIPQEIQKAYKRSSGNAPDLIKYAEKMEKDINEVLRHGGFVTNPNLNQGNYLTPYGIADTVQKARELTFLGNTQGWQKNNYKILTPDYKNRLQRSSDTRYFFLQRFGGQQTLQFFSATIEQIMPTQFKGSSADFTRELKTIRYDRGKFKNIYNRGVLGGHRGLFSAVQAQIKQTALRA